MLYNGETIKNAIHTKWAGNTVHFVKETDSTNLWAKNLARDGATHGTLAVTEFQSAGRGRFDRKWTSPEGSAVMMTLVLRPSFSPLYASMLTLVMGLSVAQAVSNLGFTASIKWPNDVVISRKKICGILTEMSANVDKINFVIIGVGINVNTESFPEEVADKGTSLYLEGGQKLDRCEVIAAVMEAFEKNYEIFEKPVTIRQEYSEMGFCAFMHGNSENCKQKSLSEGNWNGCLGRNSEGTEQLRQVCNLGQLKEEYEQLLANLNQPVRVLDSAAPYEGICRGITETGELLVECADGSVKEVGAGEVSVRGLYSYV